MRLTRLADKAPRRNLAAHLAARIVMHASLLSARTALAQAPFEPSAASGSRVLSRLHRRPPRHAGFHDLSAKDIDGNDVAFSKFKGKVVLVTNVACKWEARRAPTTRI